MRSFKSFSRISKYHTSKLRVNASRSLHGNICLSAVKFGYTKTARGILDNITKEQAAMANAKAALKEKFNSKVWLAQWRADHPDEWSSNRDRDLVTAIKLWSDSSFFKNGYQRKVNKFSGFQVKRDAFSMLVL